ncbi:MAG: RNA-protein complex protein Nop10 [Candidatus Bathyarchaeota archaeon]|nr:RNA-protein complex protein Nop10 [Candidatus Bathyarchaeota archaeon]
MKWLLRRCERCKRYTLHADRCPYCGGEVRMPHPAKFSIDDKYLKYKSLMKRRLRSDTNNNPS